MKKVILISIICLVAIVISVESFFLIKQNKALKGDKERPQNEQLPADRTSNQTREENQLYAGDDFAVAPPKDWSRAAFASTLVSWRNTGEKHPAGSGADKINFRSYIAISFDVSNGKSLSGIVELVKRQIESVAPGIVFSSVTDGTIDSEPAKFIEATLMMQNEKFKVMMAVVLKGDKYFTISCNTTLEKWSEYRNLFYNTANSFRFKY